MRRRTVGVVLLAVTLVMLASVGAGVVAARVSSGEEPASQFAGPRHPAAVEDVPFWIASAADSPPGRSILLAEGGGMFSSGYQVFAADSDRVREVPALVDREDVDYGIVTRELSPDGRWLAVGDATGSGDDVLVVDLTTGVERRYPLDAGPDGLIEVLAWSPDAGRLAVSTGVLLVLDVASGEFRKVAAPGAVSQQSLLPGEEPDDQPIGDLGAYWAQAAFSPDGRSIAYDDGTDIEVYRADGSGLLTLLTDRDVSLAGANAWSPDGTRVLVVRDEYGAVEEATSVLAIDVATQAAERLFRFDYLDFSSPMPVGWRGADEVLLSGFTEDGAIAVDAYPVGVRGGSRAERLERVAKYAGSVFSMKFAAGLIGDSVAREGAFSAGPMPRSEQVVVGVAAGVAAAILFAVVGTAIIGNGGTLSGSPLPTTSR